MAEPTLFDIGSKIKKKRDRREYGKLYRQKNAARLSEFDKERRKKNKVEISARNKAWREKNREANLAKKRAYYAANRESINAKHRSHADLDNRRAASRAYYEKNKVRILAEVHDKYSTDQAFRQSIRERRKGYRRKATLLRQAEGQKPRRPLTEIACAGCGAMFRPHNHTIKYCSRKCYLRCLPAVEHACKWCGQKFIGIKDSQALLARVHAEQFLLQ